MPITKHVKERILMAIISKQVKDDKMPELEDRKVVEHNDLITSIAKMDKTPLKIFELAASCIDTENPPKDNMDLSQVFRQIFVESVFLFSKMIFQTHLGFGNQLSYECDFDCTNLQCI